LRKMGPEPKLENSLLAVVGMPGSGKSAIVTYLKEKGWQVIHFGEMTTRELEKRSLSMNESNERMVREEFRRKYGMEAYAKLLLPEIEKALSSGPTVIDGLYSWAEYKFLKQRLHDRMYVIAVFTPPHQRYERLSRRRVRPLSHKEAELRDFAEIENLEKGGPIAMADYTIINVRSREEMLATIDKLLVSLLSRSELKEET
jgi:dephospho-CoA kinase